jgi:LysM repeat protein
MKLRRTGRHTTPSQVEKVAEKAGKAAPAMAISAGVLMAAPHGHNAAPAKHDTVATQSVTSKAAQSATGKTEHATAVLDSMVRSAQQQDRSYTVQSGDTLSSVAQQFYGKSADWAWLEHINRSKVQNADLIYPGQVLNVPADPPASYTLPASTTPATATPVASTSSPGSESDGAGSQAAPAQAGVGVAAQVAASATSTSTSATPGGAFGQCVVSRESGGNPQVMNSSGHYGLYQFSASTWAAYGGNPADFGHASAAEQNQVFATALAQGGQSNWSPYDGC